MMKTIRAWLERDEDRRPGWLGALADPDIGRALVLIHRRAEEPWTVASLAREVQLSRSIFAERFSRLVASGTSRSLAARHVNSVLSGSPCQRAHSNAGHR